MVYRILYHEDARRELERLSREAQRRIMKAVEERLSRSPEMYGKPLRFSLKGLWSLRTGDYRVIYQVEDEEVIIVRIGHRREVYDG